MHLPTGSIPSELKAGEVFYWPAGHTGWTPEGIAFLEFSPAG